MNDAYTHDEMVLYLRKKTEDFVLLESFTWTIEEEKANSLKSSKQRNKLFKWTGTFKWIEIHSVRLNVCNLSRVTATLLIKLPVVIVKIYKLSVIWYIFFFLHNPVQCHPWCKNNRHAKLKKKFVEIEFLKTKFYRKCSQYQ